MQIQEKSVSLPLFMRSHDKSLRSDIRPVSSRDYIYDEKAQRSVWITSTRGGSGYDTKIGRDWTKTDEV
jgi:hypothetical protein